MSTTADQRVTTNIYNSLGRLESVTTPEGTIHYEYDYLGRHTRTYTGDEDTTGTPTASDGIAVTDTHYAYDSLGRLDTVTTVERFDAPLTTPEVTDYFYDLLGNLDETHAPNGVITDYQYDNLNRLELLRHFRDVGDSNQTYESGVDALLAEYDYDLQSDGRRTGVTEVDSSGNTTRIDWTYDAASRLTQESYNSHDDSLDFITDYLFDLVGNRLSKKTDTNPTFLGDPTFDETVTNTHDANDRLLTETKDHLTDNSQDRHTAYTYDNTQQTQKTIHAGLDDTAPIASETTYAYNLQGRLATVTIDADGNGLSDTRLDYEYNANGIRTSQTKTTDGNNDGDFNDPEDTSTRTDYLVDNQNPTTYAQILEEWLDGQLKTSYTLAHDVLTQAAITGAIHHLLYDGHGSTRMLVDALGQPISSTNGTLQVFAYDAYGNPINFDPAQALTTLLYSGEQTDATTGFQYLRARYYDPSTGTFNRLDPFFGNLEDPQSWHKYLYTHADPIDAIDPSGRFLVTCAGLLGALAFAGGAYFTVALLHKVSIYILETMDTLGDAMGPASPSSYFSPSANMPMAVPAGDPYAAKAQARLDYLHRLRWELMYAGDNITDWDFIGYSGPAGRPLNREEWRSLRSALSYARHYDDYGTDVALWNASSMNNPFWHGITLDEETFFANDDAGALAILIHEPMHNLFYHGVHFYRAFGHEWINPIVGPYSQDNYFNRLVDYLKNSTKNGGTWWSHIQAFAAGTANWGDYYTFAY